VDSVSADVDLARMPLPDALAELQTSPAGLSGEQARARLQRYGANAIEEHRRTASAELPAFFWGPIPWTIELADLLSAVLAHWDDVAIIKRFLHHLQERLHPGP
jgi:H+-transporting ATPase